MFKHLSGAALLAISLTASSMALAVDVNINIGQPGYYGRIDIGDFGRPQLIYTEPRVINRVVTTREPVYLHVPPGHAKNWRKHCGKYNACGERVYFVKDSWYEREYVPRYQAKHKDRDEHREDRREDRHEAKHEKHDKQDKYEKHDKKHDGQGKGHGKNH